MPDFPPGFDTLASRYAMQTLFATWVTLGDATRLTACATASDSLDDLFKRADGQWHRRFDATGRVAAAKTAHATADSPDAAADPELAPLRRAIADARSTGRDKCRERLGAELGVKRQLAWTLVGLSDNPMVPDFPTRPTDVNDYVKRHAQRLRLLASGGNPPQLRDRLRQLWALYLRARVEKEFGL
jgi:hypothetical protein